MVRKMFIDNLPTKEGVGALKGRQVVDWKNSAGYKTNFQYDNIKGEVKILNYDSKTRKLDIKYLNKEPFKIDASSFRECKLGNLLSIKTNKFKIKTGQVIKDNHRNLIIINKKYKINKRNQKQKWYKYKCNICGWDEGWIREDHLLKGIGCSCCYNRTPVLGINTIWDTDKWMIKYIGEKNAKSYTHQSEEKIQVTCPDCSNIKIEKMSISAIYTTHSIGCKFCGDGVSYPQKFCLSLLKQLNINFIPEYSPNWISPKRYDFYFELNNKKYIVEMDGELGHGNKVYSKSKKTIKETKQIDDYKDKLAKEHGIKVIRIDCNYGNNIGRRINYIKDKIIYSKLNNIFDLSKIDWNKCEEYALSNLVKKACNIKKDNSNMTTTDISNMLNLSRTTIRKYLKQGTKLGWCDYNPKEEKYRKNVKAGKKSGKLVEIFKDEKSLGVFPSCAELERQSEKVFGVKLWQGCISQACNKNKEYKNFIFRYVNIRE